MSKASNVDMSGKTCVITGANTGIGRVTAVALARMGARVIVANRSAERSREVLDEISAVGATASLIELDLGSLESVRRAADQLRSETDQIDVLINNAGLAGARGKTKDGFEIHFGVNHLGHYLLTRLLLDHLATPARIVNVASRAHYRARKGLDFEAIKSTTRTRTGFPEYCASKLANVLFSLELARRVDPKEITVYALHPGVVASDIWRRVPWPMRPIVHRFMITPEQGAQTQIWCATEPELADETGLYYDKCASKTPSRHARDGMLAATLWERSAAWVELDGGPARR